MGSIRIFIFPDCTVLNIKTRKFIQFFLQNTAFLCGEVIHEHLRDIGRIAGIQPPVLNFSYTFYKQLFCNTEDIAEIKRIERLNLTHNQHDFIRRLVINQQLPVAIINDTPGRDQCLFQKRIAVSPRFIVAVHYLQKEQTNDKDENQQNNGATNHETPVLKSILRINLHFSGTLY